MTRIPKLYETEHTPFSEKIIHQHYYLPANKGFYWLIAELDARNEMAFGYANLNDPEMAEWGYISIRELEQVGAELDPNWKPKTFYDALLEIDERYSL